MKIPHIALSLIAATVTSQAATVLSTVSIVPFLTSPATSGHTQDVVFDDLAGKTVTLRFTVTTQSGESFTNLDSGVRVGVGAGGDGNHIDSTEDVTFAVKYLSHTGTVDLSSIAFRFESIGFRNLSVGASDVRWTSTGTAATLTSTALNSEAYRALDAGFTTIGSAPGNYTGTFENLASNNQGQLSRVGVNGGLKFQVQFVPEPSSALLGGLGLLALLRRRR